jgi:hypothetical protein
MERFFERIFERPAARLLAPRLEAVHLQRHLERAMEGDRSRQGSRWRVPARYRVILNPADLVALSGREALPSELAEMLREHARRRGYVLDARPSVRLEAAPRIAAGDAVVLTDDPLAAAERAAEPPVEGSPVVPPPTTDPSPPAQPAGGTAVFEAAKPVSPKATIAVRTPGRDVVRLPVEGASLRVGRARDNDIVLDDSRVSRHHGQISVRLGTLIYTDLGSTNGSYLQGSRVHEIALGPHDILQLGGSTLTIEPAAR